MRLCITKFEDRRAIVLRIDGELLAEGVEELERVARAIHPLSLDLENLQRVDDDGLALLRRLSTAGAEFRNVSAYIALLLGASPAGHDE